MMMGERQVDQSALFYEFSLGRHVPVDHMLRAIDRFVDLGEVRPHLAPFYSATGRPSVDPELLIRMLIIGYCYGIRSERRLCEEVHLNLGYRWFCRLGLAGEVPDHSTFSKNRHGRFRASDLLRHVFETVVRRCIEENLVAGDGGAPDEADRWGWQMVIVGAGNHEREDWRPRGAGRLARRRRPVPRSQKRVRRRTEAGPGSGDQHAPQAEDAVEAPRRAGSPRLPRPGSRNEHSSADDRRSAAGGHSPEGIDPRRRN